jgi:hypothetical protein
MDKVALGQTMLQLSSPDATMWDNIVMPIGWLEPGEIREVHTTIPLRTGILARVDDVRSTIHVSNRPTLQLEEQQVEVRSQPAPIVSVQANLVHDEEGLAVAIRLKNYSKNLLSNLVIYFQQPNEPTLELMDEAATVDTLSAGQEHQLRLRLNKLGQLPAKLPMTLVVETENFGKIAEWKLAIPSNGDSLRAMAPRITDATPAMRLPTGKHIITFAVSDDRTLNHAIIYVNGQKIAWHDSQDKGLGIQVVADIKAGQNVIVAIAEDDQGLRTRYQRIIKGDEPAAVDAVDANASSAEP